MSENIKELKEKIKDQLLKTKMQLFEFSFARLKQYTDNAKTTGFAILTSRRQPPKDIVDQKQLQAWKQQQKHNLETLKGEVRQKGYGFVQLRGHWRECTDVSIPYEQCPEDKLVDAIEPALLIPKIDLETSKNLGNSFNQDAILYAGPETGGIATLVFKDGNTIPLGEFSPMTLGQAYTEYRAKSDKTNRAPRYFKFEGLTCPASSYIEGLTDQALNEQIKLLSESLLVNNEHLLNRKSN